MRMLAEERKEALSKLRLALQKLYVIETNLSFINDKRIPRIKRLLEEVRVLLSSTKSLVAGERDTCLDKFRGS